MFLVATVFATVDVLAGKYLAMFLGSMYMYFDFLFNLIAHLQNSLSYPCFILLLLALLLFSPCEVRDLTRLYITLSIFPSRSYVYVVVTVT